MVIGRAFSLKLPRLLHASSIFNQRKMLLAPLPNAAIHRDYVGVPHFLQIVSCQCRAETAATVQDYFRVRIRHALLDVTFDDSFPQMNGTREMIFGVLAFFAYIDQQKFVPSIQPRLDLVDSSFVNSLFCFVDDAQKAW